LFSWDKRSVISETGNPAVYLSAIRRVLIVSTPILHRDTRPGPGMDSNVMVRLLRQVCYTDRRANDARTSQPVMARLCNTDRPRE
jgi:hypothetical protein